MENTKERIQKLCSELKDMGVKIDINIAGDSRKIVSYPHNSLEVIGCIKLRTLENIYSRLSELFTILNEHEEKITEQILQNNSI